MHKSERQDTIRKLLAANAVHSQAELAARLRKLGHTVTQASVSRDLDELGAFKVNGNYALPGSNGDSSQFGPVRFATAGENLIVGKCRSGLASAITVRIDAAAIQEIVGTIAGDDTIFIAVEGRKAQSKALKQIEGV